MEAEFFFGGRVTWREQHSSGSLGKVKSEPKSQNRDAEERGAKQECPICGRKNGEGEVCFCLSLGEELGST